MKGEKTQFLLRGAYSCGGERLQSNNPKNKCEMMNSGTSGYTDSLSQGAA